MPRTIERMSFRNAEMHLKRGARAWRMDWPQGMWVEMCVDNECKYLIHRDGTYEKWRPHLEDYSERIWCINKG